MPSSAWKKKCLTSTAVRFSRYVLRHASLHLLFLVQPPPRYTLFPYTTLFRSIHRVSGGLLRDRWVAGSSPAMTRSLAVRGEPWASRPIERNGSFRLRRNRSEEHTSELQSTVQLVCRRLLGKKNA